MHRFYAPDLTPTESTVVLPVDEMQHLTRVLRLPPGAVVAVFDGHGGLWRAAVVHATKTSAAIRALEPLPAARELSVQLTLVASVLKGDKMDDVVRDAVMLGISALQPVVSERAETSIAAMARSSRVARWQRIAVASAKQCGRAVVPPIHPAMPLDWYWNERIAARRVLCVEPAAALGEVCAVAGVAKPAALHVIVGPEGGWTVTEVAAGYESGAILMSLGPRTLRADAVPIVALTALLTTWGEM